MSTEKFLNYRGEIKSAAGAGATLAFVTVHPEGQPTGVYRLDCEGWALELDPLPAGAVDVLIDGADLWAAGSDGVVYRGAVKGGKLKPLGEALPAPPVCLAPLAGERLGVAAGQEVLVLSRKDGKVLQTLSLPEP